MDYYTHGPCLGFPPPMDVGEYSFAGRVARALCANMNMLVRLILSIIATNAEIKLPDGRDYINRPGMLVRRD